MAQAHRPFCSSRCQQNDLARWLDGSYAIAGESATTEDLRTAMADEENDENRDETLSDLHASATRTAR